MPDKMPEEKANLAKKLAEQRAKCVEGISTTAKVRHTKAHHIYFVYLLCILVFNYLIFKFAAQSR